MRQIMFSIAEMYLLLSSLAVGQGISSSAAANPDDIYWDNGLSPSISGLDGEVCAMTIYDGKLIVGGSFTIAGNVIAKNIAAWDGTSWSPLGSGTNYDVLALAVYDDKLIAGGWFTMAGGDLVNHIAAWNGTSWFPLGSGLSEENYYEENNRYVDALTVFDNNLIAGGEFTTMGGIEANNIAAWDGSAWSPLGSGISGKAGPYVSALKVYNSKLIAAGWFDGAGSDSANSIAAWNGSAWSSLGLGLDGWTCALTIYNNQLIAGGYFNNAGALRSMELPLGMALPGRRLARG